MVAVCPCELYVCSTGVGVLRVFGVHALVYQCQLDIICPIDMVFAELSFFTLSRHRIMWNELHAPKHLLATESTAILAHQQITVYNFEQGHFHYPSFWTVSASLHYSRCPVARQRKLQHRLPLWKIQQQQQKHTKNIFWNRCKQETCRGKKKPEIPGDLRFSQTLTKFGCDCTYSMCVEYIFFFRTFPGVVSNMSEMMTSYKLLVYVANSRTHLRAHRSFRMRYEHISDNKWWTHEEIL